MAIFVSMTIVLLGLVTVIIALVSQGSGDDSATVTEDDSGTFGDGLPSGSSSGKIYLMRRHDNVTEPTTPDPDLYKMLVCTFGELGVLPAMVPPDGVCDIIFYEEVFYDHKKKAIWPTHSSRSFHNLQSLSVKYTTTTFGTSMSTGAIARSVEQNKADVMAAMERLSISGMVHFGMLNVADIENYSKDGSLMYLQVVDEVLKSKDDYKRHCALGVSLKDGSKGKVILEMAKEATIDFPAITMVIIKLHAGKVASATDLWPVGPNPDGANLNKYKILTLKTLMTSLADESLKDKLQDISEGMRWVLLSFSMMVRTYRMKDNWQAPALDQVALRAIEMDYASVCKYNQVRTQSDDITNYFYDAGTKYVAIFDDVETLRTKTEERVKLLPQRYSGMAVYRVEADDFVGSCNGGRKFARLKAIRDALK